jgi:hypothetical protein
MYMYVSIMSILNFGLKKVVVESYNELQDSLSEVERMLFQHKLQEAEKVYKSTVIHRYTCIIYM